MPTDLILSDVESSLDPSVSLPEYRASRQDPQWRTTTFDRVIILALAYVPVAGVVIGLPLARALGAL